MDITNENVLAAEHDKVIYNTRVTRFALNEDWLVTVESWDDQEHSCILRLKFWQFVEEQQNYRLNTSILAPHERQVLALDLCGGRHQSGTTYCASAGNDRVIKLWTNSREVFGKGNVWQCVGRRSYRDLPVHSLCFSRDGSILVAGCGRHVVVFKGDSLRSIRCVLTAPNGLDGVISRMTVFVPAEKKPKKTPKKKQQQQSSVKDYGGIVTKYLECETGKEKDAILSEIMASMQPDQKEAKLVESSRLSSDQKRAIFEAVIGNVDLDIVDKVRTLNGLAIGWGVNAEAPEGSQLTDYLLQKEEQVEESGNIVENAGKLLSLRDKFGRMAVAREVIEVCAAASGGSSSADEVPLSGGLAKDVPHIRTILIGIGEFSHLVLVATANRVLIWNLLTLKLQSVLRLACRHITQDPVSGMIAAVTESNQCEH